MSTRASARARASARPGAGASASATAGVGAGASAWQPLPEQLPPEVRHFVEQLRGLKDRTGLSLVALGARTAYSKSSWQRYLNATQPPPRQAVVALCRVAGLASEEAERFGVRWELAVRVWPRVAVAAGPEAAGLASTAPKAAGSASTGPGVAGPASTSSASAVASAGGSLVGAQEGAGEGACGGGGACGGASGEGACRGAHEGACGRAGDGPYEHDGPYAHDGPYEDDPTLPWWDAPSPDVPAPAPVAAGRLPLYGALFLLALLLAVLVGAVTLG
ncbi:helix-turn-helix domain-containing protein [Streptomyces sp. NPDC058249]|uniref:helix-turn-helix domain-containing protein n=1 Tax=Streptomyces sp. NPDC058249 TaxID=3346403 RepID=UPI0036E915EC